MKGYQFWHKPEEVLDATPTLPTLITVIDTQETTWPCPNCSFGGYSASINVDVEKGTINYERCPKCGFTQIIKVEIHSTYKSSICPEGIPNYSAKEWVEVLTDKPVDWEKFYPPFTPTSSPK